MIRLSSDTTLKSFVYKYPNMGIPNKYTLYANDFQNSTRISYKVKLQIGS